MAPLPRVVTPALLHTLQHNPRLPPGAWPFVAAVALSALNRPDELGGVLGPALAEQPAGAQQLRVARRVREGLVKSAAVVGLPRTINALLELKRHTPAHLLDAPMQGSPSGRAIELAAVPSSALLHRGEAYFARVYGKIAARVMGQMDRSGTEDLGLTARLLYGYLLSNASILSPADSSFVLIAGLIPQDVNPQLKGHLRGALNNGASTEQVRAVREAVLAICQAAGMRTLADADGPGAWGWREDVAKI